MRCVHVAEPFDVPTKSARHLHTHTHIYTADCKIAETFSTVCNDFLVVNSCKNPWDSIGPVPIILQSAEYICMCVYIYIYIYMHCAY